MVLRQESGEHEIRAFLQATRSRSKDHATREMTPLGEVAKGQYIYIGPVEPMAQTGDELLWQSRIFEVRRAEPVMVGEDPAYCWGLCVEKGGESTWGS